mgnify:CR=1 FL=1
MKNFILKNPFVLGVVFLVIGLLGYQELKSFVFGFSTLSIALILFIVAFFKKNYGQVHRHEWNNFTNIS